MDVRFVVLVDIEKAASLEDAYRILRNRLDDSARGHWETDDEFFIDGELGDAEELSRVRTTAVMCDRIREAYGTLDAAAVWLEAASRRTGSGHAEYVVGGESYCPLCGTLAPGKGEPEWHPEQWLTE
jgi:hypothetical protein